MSSRNALVLLAVLPLSACFTFVDFSLDDGAGGSVDLGGASGGVTSSNAGGLGGEGGTGGEPCDTDLETDPDNCGACGHACEAAPCAAGVCGGALLVEADSPVGVMGVGGNRLAFQNPINNTICFIDKTAAPFSANVFGCKKSSDEGWNGLGTSLAVDAAGTAYYSPQAADSESPLYACPGSAETTTCAPTPLLLADNAGQLNGLLMHEGNVLGINPFGELWRVPVGGASPPPPTHELTLTDGTDSIALALGGGSLVIGVFGQVTPACIAVDSAALVEPDGLAQDIQCTIDIPNTITAAKVTTVSAVAAGAGGAWAARVRADIGPASRALTLVHPAGAPVGEVSVLYDLSVAHPSPALVGDEEAFYFYGRLGAANMVRVYRCPYDGNFESCAPISGAVDKEGALALEPGHVFYSSGPSIYRAVR